jgi:hypothetical protein
MKTSKNKINEDAFLSLQHFEGKKGCARALKLD